MDDCRKGISTVELVLLLGLIGAAAIFTISTIHDVAKKPFNQVSQVIQLDDRGPELNEPMLVEHQDNESKEFWIIAAGLGLIATAYASFQHFGQSKRK